MARFLASPIVLDSNYFDQILKDSRWTDKDLQVHSYLNNLADVGKDYWESYNNAKFDVDLNLKSGLDNLLIKDFKTYYVLDGGEVGIGVSTFFLSLEILFKAFDLSQI